MNRILIVITLTLIASVALASDFVTDGEIVAISIDEKTIQLEETPPPETIHAGVRREFVITEATKLTASGVEIELAEIEIGARATVHYEMDFGENIALTIEVHFPATD